MAGKLYFTYKHGQQHSTFSAFEEAVGQAYGWEMPAIVCKTGDDTTFRVTKEGDRWKQSYPDGSSRDVTERMATLFKLAESNKGRRQ